jgi:molybdopterin-containing oxidoreductase family iron-sulfur binding subunit
MGTHTNETSELTHWHIPESHYLESWSDNRSHTGLASIVQPLIKPLYKSKSVHDLLAILTDEPGVPGLEIVSKYWETQGIGAVDWRRSLHDGFIDGSVYPSLDLQTDQLTIPETTGRIADDDELEIHFRPDPMIWDGRFANNAWLQETPKPITKLTWDNAALVSPRTAERLRLKGETLAKLRFDGREIDAAVWVVPGQADGVVTLHLGYGQQSAGRVGRGLGFNAYALRTSTAFWSGVGLKIAASYASYRLASTQDHGSMEDRNLIRMATLKEYKDNPNFADGPHDPPDDLTLHNRTDHQYNGYSWGMVIDLGACTGCNACSIACQAENNIPVVGKDQVLNGREMSWIRIDRYYNGDIDNPEIVHQPVPCMHCENAPCELVCPVAATSHSDEGLNDMTYNRCVGTRYCANNCPYKVRRFNFLQYADRDTESLKLQRNPDVTTRSRGVMEKCTYCVQRINMARIEAKKANVKIADGDFSTACEQACPTDAIVFGDINDPESRVSALKASPLNYGILTELNTRPRTTYLAGIKNPNPEITEA